ANFSSETASGWQQVSFPSAVAITANTTYIASYHTNVGHYAQDAPYFSAGVDNPPLHVPSDSAAGGNGAYAYGATAASPNKPLNPSTYWGEAVFNPTSTPETPPPPVTTQSPAPSATGVSTVTGVTATFSKPVQASSIAFVLTDPTSAAVPASVTYNS